VINMNNDPKKENEKEILLVSCSGASNTGTLSDCVVRELVNENPNRYKLLCLPALALGRRNAMESLKDASHIVVLDGCAMKCATQILQEKGRLPDVSIELARDCGIKKNMIPSCEREDVKKVKELVKKATENW
jgi:uncharacterized metal-binding protein